MDSQTRLLRNIITLPMLYEACFEMSVYAPVRRQTRGVTCMQVRGNTLCASYLGESAIQISKKGKDSILAPVGPDNVYKLRDGRSEVVVDRLT